MTGDKIILAASWQCDMSWQDCFDINGGANKELWLSWHRPLSNAGANFARTNLACYGGNAPKSSLLTPFVYVPDRDAFDLYQLNPIFWTSFRKLCEWYNEIGRTIMVSIGNECEQRKPDRKAQSPWFNNIQSIDDMYQKETYSIWRTLTRKTLEVLDGLDFCIEPINEGNATKALDVFEIIIQELKAVDFPVNRISLGAQMIQCEFQGYNKPWDEQYKCANKFTNQEYIGKIIDRFYGAHKRNECWYPIHGILNPAERKDRPFGEKWTQAKEWWVEHVGNSVRLWLSSDGSDKTHGTYNGRPSGDRWYEAIKDILKAGRRNILIGKDPKFAFEVFQQGVPASVFAVVVSRCTDAIRESGYTLANEGMFPEPVVPPETEPEPEPEPEPQPEPEQQPDTPTYDCKCRYYLNIHDTWFGIPAWWNCIRGRTKPYCKVVKKP